MQTRRKANTRMAHVVVAFVAAACAVGIRTTRADFTLTGTEHQDVSLSHTTGTLWGSSTADVWQGGYIENAYLNDDARLRILDWRFGTYGTNVEYLYAYDTSSVDILRGRIYIMYAYEASDVNVSNGGKLGNLYAYGTSTVDVNVGGVLGNMYVHDSVSVQVRGGQVGNSWSNVLAAYDTSSVDISGGRIEAIAAYNSSSVTLYGYDFQATGGLTLEGQEVIGTGQLTGKWLNGTAWEINISSHDATATIRAIPEPATLGLLALGALAILRKRRR